LAGRTPLRRAAAGTLIAILAVLVLAADQLAKLAVIRSLPSETPVHVIGDFLIFYYIRNSGAAFSIGEGVTWIFTIALAVVAVVIVWLAITRVRSRAWTIVLGLLLGGVLGNLGDRLFRSPGFAVGHVVDFISTPWMLPAIYNVADMFIVCDMIAVALLVLVGVRLDGTREQRRDRGEPEEPDADAERAVATATGPTAVEGAGADRDPLFPVADAGAGAPLDDPDDPDDADDADDPDDTRVR
jgi:signal peptidase II